MNRTAKPACRFEIVKNDRLVKYLTSINLWAVEYSAIIAAPLPEYRFVIANWDDANNHLHSFAAPVIVIGVDDSEIAIRAFEQGCFDYVRSVTWGELGARLIRLASRCQDWACQDVKHWIIGDDIEIDLFAQTVKKNGAEVHLTNLEFQLLNLLGDDRGLSVQDLAELLGVGSRSVSTHVYNINRKLPDVVSGSPQWATSKKYGSRKSFYHLTKPKTKRYLSIIKEQIAPSLPV